MDGQMDERLVYARGWIDGWVVGGQMESWVNG
jgi:hypothetical protein